MNVIFFLKQKLRKFIFPLAELRSLILGIMPKKPIQVLDMGCGSGWFLRWILQNAPAGSQGYGVEVECRFFGSKILENGNSISIVAPENLLENMIFDLIVLNDVLHHVKDKRHFVGALLPKLKVGGYILIKDMNPENQIYRNWNRLHDKIASGDDISEISPSELKRLLTDLEKDGVKSHFETIASGTKIIFLYDHYWMLFRKLDNSMDAILEVIP